MGLSNARYLVAAVHAAKVVHLFSTRNVYHYYPNSHIEVTALFFYR
jgi:hypothetical protein